MDWISNLLIESALNLYGALKVMMVPTLFFICLAYIVKGRDSINDFLRALPETILNIKIQAFNILFSSPFVAIYVTAIHGFLTGNNLFLITPEFWDGVPMVVVLFLAVFLGDFFHYWRHRLDHTKLFWPAHAVHHSDTEVTWLTSARWHPINLLTMRGIGIGAMLLMGFPVYAILFNGMMRGLYGYFIHADVPWTYGWFGKFLVSPAMHRWHHSAEEKAFDKNFGEFFCVFDQAFGTYYLPGPCDGPLGVHDDMQPTLRSQITYAFTPKAYKPLMQNLRRRFGGANPTPKEN
ncbi:sterol desaturase family protein [Roseovarius sp. 2305UL8-3]|uniref:sterol desaturase family protein n=1 Tax=Roseovarius conchicola TaxID=3121636 RepID=UPI003527DC8C